MQADDNIDVVLSNVQSGASLEVFADANRGGSGDATVNLEDVTLSDVTVEMGFYGYTAELSISSSSDAAASVVDISIRSTLDV